jgi:hypothetical protein
MEPKAVRLSDIGRAETGSQNVKPSKSVWFCLYGILLLFLVRANYLDISKKSFYEQYEALKKIYPKTSN